MTAATREKIRAHLNRFWKSPKTCPICQSSKWHIQPVVVQQVLEKVPSALTIASPVAVSTVQIVCTVCYFFHNFLLVPIAGEGGSNG